MTLAFVHHLVQSIALFDAASEILAFTVSVCDIVLARFPVCPGKLEPREREREREGTR